MRMNRFADIDRVATHFDRETHFANEIAGVRADDAAADATMVGLVEQELGEAFVAAVGDCPARSRPRKHCLAVLDPLRLALLLSESGPSHFGIRVGDRWNLPRVEERLLPGSDLR